MYTGGFIPHKLDYITQQHLWRYVFASDFVNGKRVLDVACGIGYGTQYLKTSGATRAVGVDLSEFAISHSAAHSNHAGVDFCLADVLFLPFESHSFDVVVSFETIEHILQYESYISQIRRVLKQGGLFICSTPNTEYTHYNRWHVKEFKQVEFFQILEDRFENTIPFGQYFRVKDRLRDFFVLDLKKGATRFTRKVLESVPLGNGIIERYIGRQERKALALNLTIQKDVLDPFYRVVPVEDSEKPHLRIMVAVCRNK